MKALFAIMPHAKLWIGICILAMAGWILLFRTNQQYSIQFTGGIEMVIDAPTVDESITTIIRSSLQEVWLSPQNISLGKKDDFASLLIQMKLANDEQVQQVTELMTNTLIENNIIASADNILEQSIIGPSIGDYMKRSATQAIIRGVILIAIYILFAFAEMRHLVSPALLGVITIFTMLFDIAIPAWLYGLWIMINPAIQIDAVFIIAILTVMGYSINDTIINFDRVRENYINRQAQFEAGKGNVTELFEHSVWQTMRRSIGTSLSTFLVVVAMRIFWTGALKTFSFTFGVGVLAGSFSSIFIAVPLAYLASKKTLHKTH